MIKKHTKLVSLTVVVLVAAATLFHIATPRSSTPTPHHQDEGGEGPQGTTTGQDQSPAPPPDEDPTARSPNSPPPSRPREDQGILAQDEATPAAMDQLNLRDLTAVAQQSRHTQVCPNPVTLTPGELVAAKYLTFDPPSEAFGLTNQLITLGGAIHLALRMGRILLLPGNATVPLWELLDVPETLKHFPCNFSMVNYNQVQRVDSKGKKFPRVHLLGRVFTAEHPYHAAKLVHRLAEKHKDARGLRLSTVMWHVPYTDRDPLQWTEHYIMRSLRFHKDKVMKRTRALLAALLATTPHNSLSSSSSRNDRDGEFVGLHLRLERDIGLFKMDQPVRRPKAETLKHLLQTCIAGRILESSVTPKMRKRGAAKILYVSAGTSITAADRAMIKATLTGSSPSNKGETNDDSEEGGGRKENKRNQHLFDHVYFKEDLLTAQSGWSVSQHGKNATNHFEAASDLMVLQQATHVITADFSTFARFLQFHRCEPRAFQQKAPSGKVDPNRNMCLGSQNHDAGGGAGPEYSSSVPDQTSVFTYDQHYNSLVARRCCDPFTGGLESTPFALLQHYKASAVKKDTRGGELVCGPPS